MTTSGVSTFNLSRDEIITEALTNCGQFDPEGQGSPSPGQLNQGSLRLNTLLKAWQVDGLQIWKRQLGVVFLQNAQGTYQLGSNGGAGGDHASLATGVIPTTVSTTALSGAFSLSVVNTTGMVSGYNIGIQLSTGFLQWTTINGAPSNNIVTLTNALTADVNTNAVVYVYQTKLSRPLRLLDGYMRAPAGNDTPIRVLSFEEYNRFGIKTSVGFTTQCFLLPQIGYSTLSIYPVPNNVGNRLFVELHYPFEDFTEGTDNPDMPQEWLQALIWGLSKELAVGFGVTETRMAFIERYADYWRNFALSSSQENSVYMQPDPMMAWSEPRNG